MMVDLKAYAELVDWLQKATGIVKQDYKERSTITQTPVQLAIVTSGFATLGQKLGELYKPNPAMEWFSRFYVTPAMEKEGFKSQKGEEKERKLSVAASSFYDHMNLELIPDPQPQAFDETTLVNIYREYMAPYTDHPLSFQDDRGKYIESMAAIITGEYDGEDVGNEYHPILLLTTGILTTNNWELLSDNDLAKIARAHGSEAKTRIEQVADVLRSQVVVTKELWDHNYVDEARSFSVILGVLSDSARLTKISLKLDRQRIEKRFHANRISESQLTEPNL